MTVKATKTADRYGVGFGKVLRSQRTGNLRTASIELIRLIRAGVDPTRLQILPVMVCPTCKGKKEFHNRVYSAMCDDCSGFGWIVEGSRRTDHNSNALSADVIASAKVSFMSPPKTTARDRRSYLVRYVGEQPAIVRVFTKPALQFVCDCKAAADGENCKHAAAARVIDRRRFSQKENKQ